MDTTTDTTTPRPKRFGRVEAINRVCGVIRQTHTPKSYTYTIGVADNQSDLVVDGHETVTAAVMFESSKQVPAQLAYTGEIGSLIRRHNSLFQVRVSKRNGEQAETFFLWMGDANTPAQRIVL